MSKSRVRRAEKISDVLSRTLSGLGLNERLREADVVRLFPEIVGAKIAEKARAISINKGILRVKVSSAVWRQELNLTRQEMIDKLNAACGELVVKDIHFS
jgi:predicted nucleic acid-binding Zn ribbon protein